MDSREEAVPEALARIRDAVTRLAAGADEQNAYLHPCGWTRDEPYEHVTPHPPCMPMGELCDAFDDILIVWSSQLGLLLTGRARSALDALTARVHDYFSVPYADEISTLESADWDEVRQVAHKTLQVLDAELTTVAPSR